MILKLFLDSNFITILPKSIGNMKCETLFLHDNKIST